MAYSLGTKDSELKELRDEFASDEDAWSHIREEGDVCIRHIAGDPWETAERLTRETAGRPVMVSDEFSQYVNACINNIRANKRAIKVTPNGNGATDKAAQRFAEWIRQVEYRSNAADAYTTMFENTVQRGFGWVRIVAEYLPSSDQQELLIRPIPNPNMVVPGPHIMADGSDMEGLWFRERMSKAQFKRKWGKAEITDIGKEWGDIAGNLWVGESDVVVCERWVKEYTTRKLVQAQHKEHGYRTMHKGEGDKLFGLDGEPDTDGYKAVKDLRDDRVSNICQYITNGIEILEKNEFPGKELPWVPCYGKILFVNEDGKTARKIQGMVGPGARAMNMLHCYYISAEAEEIGSVPRVPYFVRKGSLDVMNRTLMEKSNHERVAYIEVEHSIEGAPPGFVPEMPQYAERNPPIQSIAIGKEGARMGIQASMGTTWLPTSAQRHSEKSGKALEQMDDASQRGSFHLTDHYEAAIMRVGVILQSVAEYYMDTPREQTFRRPDDSTYIARINDPGWVDPETNKPEHIRFDQGDFDVTISTGPKTDSEHEAGAQFADLLVEMMPTLLPVIGPEKATELLGLSVQLKNVGPIGDRIKDIISPQKEEGQDDPAQLKQQNAQLQQAADMLSKELEQRVKDAETEQIKAQQQLQADRIKADEHIQLENLKFKHDIILQQMKDATAIRQTEVAAQSKGLQIAADHDTAHEKLALGTAVEVDEAERGRQHEAAMAERGHQQNLEAGDVAHQQAIEQGELGHEQALEQGAQAAALKPEPEGE